MEDQILLQSLKTQDRFAVITSLNKDMDYLTTLKENFKIKQCHIGKKSFGKLGTSFILVGLIPPYIILRLKAIQKLGVWNGWEGFLHSVRSRDGAIFRPTDRRCRKQQWLGI